MVGLASQPVLSLSLRLWSALQTVWPGARILKTALAVGLAWWIGQLLGQPRPIFAALAALQAMRPTVAASLRHWAGQLLGMLGGTALALLTSRLFGGPEVFGISLAVLLGLVATARFGAGSWLGTEIAVTAMLSFALAQGQPFWGLERLWEAAVGGSVSIAINALILPPDYLLDARQSIQLISRDVVRFLHAAVEDFLEGRAPAEVHAHLVEARLAVQRANERVAQSRRAQEALAFSPLLRYSPLRRGTVEQVDRCVRGAEVLAGLLVHARTALRAAWQASRRHAVPTRGRESWEETLELVRAAVRSYERYTLEGGAGARQALVAAIEHARKHHAALLNSGAAPHAPLPTIDEAALASELEHVLDDLSAAARSAAEPGAR